MLAFLIVFLILLILIYIAKVISYKLIEIKGRKEEYVKRRKEYNMLQRIESDLRTGIAKSKNIYTTSFINQCHALHYMTRQNLAVSRKSFIARIHVY